MQFIDLGLIPYREALALQEDSQRAVISGAEERVYLCEHMNVYTLGRHGNPDNMLSLPSDAELIKIGRGGDITYHGPGQLVVYPIINLNHHHLGVKSYINLLEESVIRLLERYGIKGERVDGATGVWIDKDKPGERKICAIGVKINRGVSMHGFALNVNTHLEHFSAINPCGFTDKGVTSIQRELSTVTSMQEVKQHFCSLFESLLSDATLQV